MPRRTIANKAIIITGASSGIGRATALLLSREGAKLLLVARRKDLLLELEREVNEAGATAIALALDLREKDNIKKMIGRARDQFGRIDVLISNAGFGFYGSVENTPAEVIREIFDLNFEAPLFAAQFAIPIMRAQGGGHIINISSVAGKRGLPLSGIYCATKFALNGISESLRVELKTARIDVSIINPAATRTEFGESVRRGDVIGTFESLGHVQSAEEVAAAIVRCIREPKAEVYPYGLSRFLAWANVLAPALVDKIMARVFNRRISAQASARA